MEKFLTIFCKKILLHQIFTGLFSPFQSFFEKPDWKNFPQQLAQHKSENFRFFDRVRVFFQKAMKLEMGLTPGPKGVVDRAGKHRLLIRPNFLLVKQTPSRISQAKPVILITRTLLTPIPRVFPPNPQHYFNLSHHPAANDPFSLRKYPPTFH